MLETFWRTNVQSTNRIHEAASQYGPYAVLSLVALAAELLVVILASINRAWAIGVVAVVLELFVLWSLRWAIVRTRATKREQLLHT